MDPAEWEVRYTPVSPGRDDAASPRPTVSVRGLGTASARPDGVRVVLTAGHRSEAARETLDEAARKARILEDLFTEFSIGPDRWVTTGIGLEELTPLA